MQSGVRWLSADAKHNEENGEYRLHGQMRTNCGDERDDVTQVILDDVFDDADVNVGIAMHQDISETNGGAQRAGLLLCQPTGSRQQREKLEVRGGLAELFV
jgi:hypothetical protein